MLPEDEGKRRSPALAKGSKRWLCSITRYLIPLLALAMFAMLPLFLFGDALALSMLGPLTLSAPQLRSAHSSPLLEITAGQQMIIATTVTNRYSSEDVALIAIVEVRDSDGVTRYLAWQSGKLDAGGHLEVGASWVPDRAGSYELRVFVISDDWENPQVLSAVSMSEVTIGHEISGSYPLSVRDTIFDVPYYFTGDIRILNMTATIEYIIITATVDVSEDSTFEIRLPEKMMEEFQAAGSYCFGGDFVVFIDGKEAVVTSEQTGDGKILSLQVEKGSETIEIIGSNLLILPPCPA